MPVRGRKGTKPRKSHKGTQGGEEKEETGGPFNEKLKKREKPSWGSSFFRKGGSGGGGGGGEKGSRLPGEKKAALSPRQHKEKGDPNFARRESSIGKVPLAWKKRCSIQTHERSKRRKLPREWKGNFPPSKVPPVKSTPRR